MQAETYGAITSPALIPHECERSFSQRRRRYTGTGLKAADCGSGLLAAQAIFDVEEALMPVSNENAIVERAISDHAGPTRRACKGVIHERRKSSE
jgi:hypothetical protein